MTERTINAERVEQLIDVFGSFDENIRKIEEAFGVKILTLPVGGFLVLGCLIALMQWALARAKKKEETK